MNRENQYQDNIWIALIARSESDYMIVGFIRARQLNMKRYLALSVVRRYALVSWDDWVRMINS